MDGLGRGLTTAAMVLAVIVWCVSLTFVGERASLFYLAMTAIVVLPMGSPVRPIQPATAASSG